MIDERRMEIPASCRQFSEGSIDERRQTAKNFIEEFVRRVAPSTIFDDSSQKWTESVRRRFLDICPADCMTVPKDPSSPKGEFLVDLTWEEKGGGKRILFACECEWGADRYGATHWYPVEEDFEKLLAVKAPFKVLIFSSCFANESLQHGPEADFSVEYAKERLSASLSNYGHHLPGEVYSFFDFPRTGVRNGSGKFRAFIWLAEPNRTTDVEFEEILNGDLNRPPEA
jgi:hypothetical protein